MHVMESTMYMLRLRTYVMESRTYMLKLNTYVMERAGNWHVRGQAWDVRDGILDVPGRFDNVRDGM